MYARAFFLNNGNIYLSNFLSMPIPKTILIVEDELLIAEDLKELLAEEGYTSVYKARNYAQATAVLAEKAIDLALIDIQLGDHDEAGISVAHHINQMAPMPFIYLTSYSDINTIEAVQKTRPWAFLLKPYSKEQLLASIKIAYTNFKAIPVPQVSIAAPVNTYVNEDTFTEEPLIVNEHLLIKDATQFVKVALKDIYWFESDRNYVKVKTQHKVYLLRISLKELEFSLPKKMFLRCYKQYIVNVASITTFSSKSIFIDGNEIPISRMLQQQVLQRLKYT
jgi:DNA-binding LytR/AlgR family response regulator